MAQRQATDPDTLDYFPTPPWAARAGGELIRRLDPPSDDPDDDRWAWEPACGGGHMAHGLKDYFAAVHATDIHDYGWPGRHGDPLDFLSAEADAVDEADWIVTNPPFIHGEAFLRAAYRRARRGVALLLRSVFREGGARARMFAELPLTANAQFAERVPMVKGRWDPEASSATAYSWFIWIKPGLGHWSEPLLADIRAATGDPCAALDLIIPPGTKARLSRPDDVRLFGAKAETPLFNPKSEET
jgi:hypothetical protein